MSLPKAVQEEMEKTRHDLDALGVAYKGALKEQVDADSAYEIDSNRALLILYHDCKKNGERLPGEDVRRALVHESIGFDTYAIHLNAKAKVEALSKQLRVKHAILSALQSELAQLREEFKSIA